MDSKNIFCFVYTELQKPPEIHASRLEYPFKEPRYVATAFSIVIVRLRILFVASFTVSDCFPILLSQSGQSRPVAMPTKFQKISYNPRDVLGWQLSNYDKTPNVIRW